MAGPNLRADTEISIDDVPPAISYAAPLRLFFFCNSNIKEQQRQMHHRLIFATSTFQGSSITLDFFSMHQTIAKYLTS